MSVDTFLQLKPSKPLITYDMSPLVLSHLYQHLSAPTHHRATYSPLDVDSGSSLGFPACYLNIVRGGNFFSRLLEICGFFCGRYDDKPMLTDTMVINTPKL